MTIENFWTEEVVEEEVVEEAIDKTREEIIETKGYLKNQNCYDNNAITKYESYKDEFPEAYENALASKNKFDAEFDDKNSIDIFFTKYKNKPGIKEKRGLIKKKKNYISYKENRKKTLKINQREMKENFDKLDNEYGLLNKYINKKASGDTEFVKLESILNQVGLDMSSSKDKVMSHMAIIEVQKDKAKGVFDNISNDITEINDEITEINDEIKDYETIIQQNLEEEQRKVQIIDDYIANHKYLNLEISALNGRVRHIETQWWYLQKNFNEYYNSYFNEYAFEYTSNGKNDDENTDISINLYEKQETALLNAYQNLLRDYLEAYFNKEWKNEIRWDNEMSFVNIKEELAIYNSIPNKEKIDITLLSNIANNNHNNKRIKIIALYDIITAIWTEEIQNNLYPSNNQRVSPRPINKEKEEEGIDYNFTRYPNDIDDNGDPREVFKNDADERDYRKVIEDLG